MERSFQSFVFNNRQKKAGGLEEITGFYG